MVGRTLTKNRARAMVETHLDALPVSALPDRYGVARSQVYNRIKVLGIETQKRVGKAYVDAAQLAQLDHIAQLIGAGKTLEEAAAIILQGEPFTQPHKTAQDSPATVGVSSLSMPSALPPTDPSALLHLLGAMAAATSPPPPPSPLARFEQLQAIADNDWRPSSSELADILGLSSLSGQQFERYGFRFTRAGRNGQQSAWKVEKL
jgi:hypothetical protein